MNIEDMMLNVEQHVEVKGDIGAVFERMLYRFGEGNVRPDGQPMQLILEAWPGGRWFRDRGNGIGHLWGHVQVIKPPVLLELSGPMFMSYPALNHLELKLEATASGTSVTLRHRALGLIDPEHRAGVSTGWRYILGTLSEDFA